MNVRLVAADVLTAARTADAWVGEVLDQFLANAEASRPREGTEGATGRVTVGSGGASSGPLRGRLALSGPDRRLATQIVLGVVRRRATLDALVRPHVSRPFHEVQEPLVDLLRVGAYQLAFLTHVPRHAAVHETVEATLPPARGFVNAVLRRVSEAVTDEFVRVPAVDAVPMDSESLPVATGRLSPPPYRKLAKPLLPDPTTHPAAYLAAAFSWPRWLADRWLDRHGFAECVRLGFWFNAPPPLWLRVNAKQLPREAYRLALAAAGTAAHPGGHPQSLTLPDPPPVRQLPGYEAGEFAVQDLASMAVASAVGPQPGWRVLDLCAAPGGKTTHLAELMGDRGEVVACDVDPRRLDTVTTLCQRLRLRCVTPRLVDKRDTVPPPGPYHAALVDAPCSNTGVLGRRPEARWRLHPTEFPDLIRLQTRLLIAAVEAVRPGGLVVYSTCSIEPDGPPGRRRVLGAAAETGLTRGERGGVESGINRRRAMSTVAVRVITPGRFLTLGDKAHGFELIDGHLVEKPVSKESSRTNARVVQHLGRYADARGGWVYDGELGYQCFPEKAKQVRKADVSYISFARMPGETYTDEGFCSICPELAVEVLSPKDLAYAVEAKWHEWLAAGTSEVWILDPVHQTVRVHRADGGIALLRASGSLTTPLLPGFTVPVAALFRRPTAAGGAP